MKRIQQAAIAADLEKKITIIVGPRQAGKTWLSQQLMSSFSHPVYLNYDSLVDRQLMNKQSWLANTDLLILDELYKMPNWKNYLKGLFDTKPTQLKLLVTGSARMNAFHQVGDSLAGRYFMHRLLPFSPAEVHQLQHPIDLDHFIERGGFPEPFLNDSAIDAKRWRQQYTNSLLSTDVLDFDNIQNLSAMRLLVNLLRQRVGSPVSYQSLAEDIAISASTVKKYIEVLEALYIVFRITPYANNIARSLRKEPKIYFFDNGLVDGDAGAKFENLVANCLLKHCYARVDYQAEDCQLHYLRTKEKHEVDFALVNHDKVEQIIEVKYADANIAKPLRYFAEKYQLNAVQVVKQLKHEYSNNGIDVLKAENFLTSLYL